MAAVNYAKFRITGSVGGLSLSGDRKYEAVPNEVLTLELESPAPVLSVLYEVYDSTVPDSPLASHNAPSIFFTGGVKQKLVSPASGSTTLTMSADAASSHTYILRATASIAGEVHVFERLIVHNRISAAKPIPGQTTQGGERGWADEFAILVEEVDTGGGGGGGGGSGSSSLYWKDAVFVATTENISLTGPQTIDTASVPNNARVLVKNQTDPSQNGIYVANTSGAWSRASDFNSDANVFRGAAVLVMSGVENGNTEWWMDNVTTIIVGTNPLTFKMVEGKNAVIDVFTDGNVSVPIARQHTVIRLRAILSAPRTLTFDMSNCPQNAVVRIAHATDVSPGQNWLINDSIGLVHTMPATPLGWADFVIFPVAGVAKRIGDSTQAAAIDLEDVLIAGNDAGGFRIEGLDEGEETTDAANVSQVLVDYHEFTVDQSDSYDLVSPLTILYWNVARAANRSLTLSVNPDGAAKNAGARVIVYQNPDTAQDFRLDVGTLIGGTFTFVQMNDPDDWTELVTDPVAAHGFLEGRNHKAAYLLDGSRPLRRFIEYVEVPDTVMGMDIPGTSTLTGEDLELRAQATSANNEDGGAARLLAGNSTGTGGVGGVLQLLAGFGATDGHVEIGVQGGAPTMRVTDSEILAFSGLAARNTNDPTDTKAYLNVVDGAVDTEFDTSQTVIVSITLEEGKVYNISAFATVRSTTGGGGTCFHRQLINGDFERPTGGGATDVSSPDGYGRAGFEATPGDYTFVFDTDGNDVDIILTAEAGAPNNAAGSVIYTILVSDMP